ncbi:MAG: RimK family alpha-L-glutamate ligase [Halobacteriales archaeon]
MPARSSIALAIVTGEDAPELTANGQAVRTALEDRGFSARPAVWSDPTVDWSAFDALLLRSCWDYHASPEAFRSWLQRCETQGLAILNPPAVVRWNIHKFYLRDLATAGVAIPETAWIEQGSDVSLADVLDDHGWTEAVVKPAIGAKSANAFRTSIEAAGNEQDRFEALLAKQDVLVQTFVPEITDGERSLVFFGGDYSHASISRPADDDFRTHPNYGGTTEPFTPDSELIDQAQTVLATAADILGIDTATLPYARIDGIDRSGTFHLMELELIEPYLGLDRADGALERFVEEVETALQAHPRLTDSPV